MSLLGWIIIIGVGLLMLLIGVALFVVGYYWDKRGGVVVESLEDGSTISCNPKTERNGVKEETTKIVQYRGPFGWFPEKEVTLPGKIYWIKNTSQIKTRGLYPAEALLQGINNDYMILKKKCAKLQLEASHHRTSYHKEKSKNEREKKEELNYMASTVVEMMPVNMSKSSKKGGQSGNRGSN